ncbi:MAG TPA: glutamate racemase [Armatimonadota bacterium]|nr:glutamate racemase [Armatimonadota bacterium]HOS43596.1 glutamate racemase [Armatimonadota bacterium]
MPDAADPTIGVFDSGVGGLTVARAVLARVPRARLVYLADTAHVPYGPRPLAQVRDFAVQIIAFLFGQGADAVVMGCNMSSAAGAHTVATARFSRPVFEVIGPGSAAACAATRSGAIGVIATQGTVHSGAYGRALRACGATQVREQACPAFVPLVERGVSDGPEVEAAVTAYLTPLRDAGMDTLVFGCTHYPFLRAPIARFLGPDVTLIDPAEFVARQVETLFGAGAAPPDPARHRFFSSGDPESLRREGERFLGLPLPRVTRVDVPVERAVEA